MTIQGDPDPPSPLSIRPNAIYTSGEVASIYRVGLATVRNWVKAGKLVPLIDRDRGSGRRFLGSDVMALMNRLTLAAD